VQLTEAIMFRPYLLALAMIFATTASSPLLAQVYKWVDENGKVHYADRKPEDRETQEMEGDLGKINVTKSQPVPDEVRIRRETDAEKAVSARQSLEEQREIAAREKQCSLVRHRLKVMSGPVYFTDENGNDYDISEQERAKREDQLRRAVQRYCD
jgi:hypothetical protein